MKTLLIAMVAALAFNVNAAVFNETTNPTLDTTFLDVGLSHWDTNTDLEWMNFSDLVEGSITMGISINEAEAWYNPQGWQLPTYTEMYTLFDTFFEPDFVDSGNGTMVLAEDDGTSTLIQSRNSWLLDFGSDATEVFGSSTASDALLYSTGLYVDENGDVQIMGIKFDVAGLSTTIYGPGFDLTTLDRDSKFSNMGVFMVQDHVVPIPAAIWLFGTGLLGLIAVARRKT